MLRKKQNSYGTFVTKPAWFFRRTPLFISLASTIILVLALSFGFKFFKHGPKAVSFVSEASASDLPGWWYKDNFGASACVEDSCKPDADPDKDKLNNAQEFYYHSNPLNRDTNSNGLADGEDVAHNYDPSKPGKVTFDQVAADDNILGESLVFNQDVKKIVNEANDISKVKIPVIPDTDVQTIFQIDPETTKTYLTTLHDTIENYFPQSDVTRVVETIKSGDDDALEGIKTKAIMLAIDLKKIPVPAKFVTFHKYNIAFYQLLSEVIPEPVDLSSTESEIWYDKVQAFLAIQQKLSFEKDLLNKVSQ
ncbi:MAG TPA: hypothetical protein VGQ87_02565 [Patescibacteria group bacterium]|jgi:hypothetical protein|nr:hypothetical protein [Patescibacteria group bacterium]